MTTVADVDLRGWSIQASSPFKDGRYPVSTRPAGQLGTNLVEHKDWQEEMPFVDLVKSHRIWTTDLLGSNTDELNLVEFDTDGWPLALFDNGGSYTSLAMIWDFADNLPSDRFILTYDGEATITASQGCTTISATPNTGDGGRQVIDIAGQGSFTQIKIFTNNVNNPLKNMKIVREVDEFVDTVANPFRADWLATLDIYSNIRHMDWQRTNFSPNVTWGDRARVSDIKWTGDNGVPPEIQIALCNTLGVDGWFCVPHQADDDYVTQFATMVKAQLNPTLNHYIEYSNEMWNFGFGQYNYAKAQALALWGGEHAFAWYGYRADQVLGLWKAVWADDITRVTAVFGAQSNWTSPITNALTCPYEPLIDTTKYVDAIAIAPYFQLANTDQGDRTALELLTVDDVFTDLIDAGVPAALADIDTNKAIADSYGFSLISYEGGQHLGGYGDAQNSSIVTTLFTTVNSDPRMGTLYTSYLNGWKDRTSNSLFNHWYHIGTHGRFGSWGSYRYFGEPITPKRQALENY